MDASSMNISSGGSRADIAKFFSPAKIPYVQCFHLWNLSRGIVPEFGVRLVSWNTVGKEHFILRTYCVSSEVYSSYVHFYLSCFVWVVYCTVHVCAIIMYYVYTWELCYQLSLAHPFKLHSFNIYTYVQCTLCNICSILHVKQQVQKCPNIAFVRGLFSYEVMLKVQSTLASTDHTGKFFPSFIWRTGHSIAGGFNVVKKGRAWTPSRSI